jgi:TIR domain
MFPNEIQIALFTGNDTDVPMASNDGAYGDGGRKPASVFLSHAHLDKGIARQVVLELRRHSVYCWFDEAELKPGDSLIQRLQTAIDNTDYLVVLLSPTSVSSAWVQKELNSVLVEEIKGRRVRVVPVMIADCEVPRFLMDKIRIDLRDDFLRGISELISFLKGEQAEALIPPKIAIADLLARAPRGLWETIRMPSVGQKDMANLVRAMTDKEIDAAIATGGEWSASKRWESDLIGSLEDELKVSPAEAKRLLGRLKDLGLIALASDLDYRRGQVAYTQEAPLWVLTRAAQQTGLFESLGAPEPYSLSQFLMYRQPVMLVSISTGFYANKFDTLLLIENSPAFAVIHGPREEPQQSWIFSNPHDDRPRHIFGLLRGVPRPRGAHHVTVWMNLEEFDDLGWLRPGAPAPSH